MRTRLALTFVLAAGGFGLGALASTRERADSPSQTPPTLPTVAREAPLPAQRALQESLDSSRRTAIVQAAERVEAAVVSVNVVRRERVQPRSLWESFFVPPGAQQEVPGLGSGFLVREDGVVLTNEHVVRGAERVVVTLPDGREYDAEVVGTDELNDVAVLRVQPEATLPVAPLGDSDDLLIGEWVVALGNPFGYLLANTEPTVTAGVVSGVGRHILPADGERGYYLDMIQTDASINPGNSGGPLVNALGEVVGLNSSIISRSGGSEGLGFAIPINRARRIAEELLASGRTRRAWIGAEVEATEAGVETRRRGVRVARVTPDSPAERAGLRPGMTLLSVGGRRVRTPWDWEARLLTAQVEQPLEVVALEGERRRELRVVPSDLPSLTAERVRALRDFELVTLTPAIRAERELVSEQGALIVGLSETAGRELGLRRGDLIVQINRQPVRSAEEAAALMRRLAGRGPVRLFYERAGQLGSTSFYITG